MRRTIAGLIGGLLLSVSCGGPGGQQQQPVSREAQTPDGVHLHLRVVGAGRQIILLLHGGPGLSLAEMRPYEALRGAGRTLVAYDQRGSGRTVTPAGADYGIGPQVADLDAVGRTVGTGKVWLIGQSWGGLLAGAYAAAHPDRVAGLALLDAAPPDLTAFTSGQRAFARRLARLTAEGVVRSGSAPASGGSCLPALDRTLPVYAADPRHPPRQPEGITCTAGTAEATFAAVIRPGVLQGIARGLRSYSGPALILSGADDAFGPSWPQAWGSLLPQATRILVPAAGHDPVLEQPAAVLAAVDRFLRGEPPPVGRH